MARSVPQIPVVLASLLLWGSFAWGLPAEAPAAEGEVEVAPAEVAWRCDRCGTVNDASAKYCMECGAEKGGEAEVAPVEGAWRCDQCGTVNDASAKYCMECGGQRPAEGEAAPKDPWAGVKISDAHDFAKCPSCGENNDLRAERCVVCGHELPQPMAELAYPPWVFVPGEGYYREGTLLEPAQTNKTLWITGLVIAAGGVVYTSNRFSIAFENPTGTHMLEILVGISVTALGVALTVFGFKKTEPVYAFPSRELYEADTNVARGERAPCADGATLKIEGTLISF